MDIAFFCFLLACEVRDSGLIKGFVKEACMWKEALASSMTKLYLFFHFSLLFWGETQPYIPLSSGEPCKALQMTFLQSPSLGLSNEETNSTIASSSPRVERVGETQYRKKSFQRNSHICPFQTSKNVSYSQIAPG